MTAATATTWLTLALLLPSQRDPAATQPVAIVGAVQGMPAVYEMPATTTIRDAFSAAGGLNEDATGRFMLFRNGVVIEGVSDELPLASGDVVIVSADRESTKPSRTVVLYSSTGRPLVVEVPIAASTLQQIQAKLPERLANTARVAWPYTSGQLSDGSIIAIEQHDPEFWSQMEHRLPTRQPLETLGSTSPIGETSESASVLPNQPASLAEPTPEIVAPAPAMVIQPAPVAEPGPLPLLAPPTASSSAKPIEHEAIAATNVVEALATGDTANQTAITITQADVIRPIEHPISSPGLAAPLKTEPTFAEPLDAARGLATNIGASGPAPESIISPTATAESPNSTPTTFIVVAVAIVLIVSGGYAFIHGPSNAAALADANVENSLLETELSESEEHDHVISIASMNVVREGAPIPMPLSIAGRSVALGKLRIDSAHTEPSGPHFAVGRDSSRNQPAPATVAHSEIPQGDVLGRALAAMSRERAA